MVDILGAWGQDSARDEEVPAMQWMGLPVPQDQMPGIATPAQIAQLKAATGAEADKVFAELMTADHQGGIHMAHTRRNTRVERACSPSGPLDGREPTKRYRRADPPRPGGLSRPPRP